MNILRVHLLAVLAGIILLASCKHHNKPVMESDPIFQQQPRLKELTEKIGDNPKDASLYYDRGMVLHRLQYDSLAVIDLKKATKLDTTKAEYYSAAGNILFDSKDINGAIEYIQKAIKLNPRDAVAHLKIAKLFLYMQNYRNAFAEINIVLKQNVYNPEAYFIKGLVYRDMKDTARAISSFQTAIQVSPDYRDAVLGLAQLYTQKHNDLALKYYDNAFRIDTTDVFPLFARGVYYQTFNNWEQAKAEYKNTIIHDNQYADAYFNLGWILMQQDSVERAKRQYDLVTKIEPANPNAYYNRGLCSELMNDKTAAITDYRQALVFNKKYQEAKDGLKRLGASADAAQ